MKGFQGGAEETGSKLPINLHGNMKTVSSDNSLLDVMQTIKSSKTPAVINYGASWCRVYNQILPTFCKLCNDFPKFSFIYADIVQKPLSVYVTFLHFISSEMAKELMKCLAPEKKGCGIDYGCTPKIYCSRCARMIIQSPCLNGIYIRPWHGL